MNIYHNITNGLLAILGIFIMILVYAKVSLEIIISITGDGLLFWIILLIYRSLVERIETKVASATGASCSRINKMCENLEVFDIEEKDFVVRIHVRCKMNLMREAGCPIRCEGYRTKLPTGSGAMGGALVLGILGAIIGGIGGALAGAIIGAGLGNLVESNQLVSEVEEKIRKYRAEGKDIIIVYHPS